MRAILLAGALLVPAALGAQAPDVSETLSSGTPDEQRKALDAILARPASSPSVDMFLASAVALQLGRVEDAGFLLYAAQVRARVDLDRFPPKGQGGDSPGVLIGALSMQVGQAVNPALMRDPKAFASAIARLRAWDAVAPDPYDPGWEHAKAKPLAQARASAETMKGDALQPAENMVRLLGTPEYFEAFKVLQDFNLNPSTGQPPPDRIASARKAEQTMAAIEQRLGIPGLFSAQGVPPSRMNAAPAPPATTPARQPRRVGGAIAEPKRLRFVPPTVPRDLPADVPRTVILELTVDERGRVVDATVLRGHPSVDRAVAEALRQWVYEPALEFGKPVPVIFTVTVNLR